MQYILFDYELDETALSLINLNNDDEIDILDIVLLVNIILDSDSNLTRDITEIIVYKSVEGIKITEDFPSSYDILITHSMSATLIIDDNNFLGMFNTKHDTSRIMIINPEPGYLFTIDGPFEIIQIVAAMGNSYSDVSIIELPTEYQIKSLYPNPFNPICNIEFGLPVDSEVIITVYNLQGREVAQIQNGSMNLGYHNLWWDASAYSSGIYFVNITMYDPLNKGNQFAEIRKITLLK